METHRPLIGTPVQELDTPCLLVDLDALEQNFSHVADTYRHTSTKMRQHTKNIKSPAMARLQIEAGGTVGGVCTAKVSEAEVMVDGGIDDILIPNQIVARDKIARLCALAKRADMKVCVDDPRNVREISEVAQSYGVEVGILIEVDTSMGRAGVRRVQQGVDLARLAHELPGVRFKGVMSHQGIPGAPDRETRFTEGRRYIQMCLDVKDAIEAEGIPVEMVSSGETWTYDVAAGMPEVTEVEGGTYALMDTHLDHMDDFQYAARILATVISTPRPGIAVGDVGSRALASPFGLLPSVVGLPSVFVDALHEEHIILRSEGENPLQVGEKFVLHSGQQDIMVNRWDHYILVRNDTVEAVWDVAARGCFH